MNKKDTDIKNIIVTSSLHLAVEQGWEYTTLRDVAEHSGLSASELYAAIDDKNDILVILGRIIDQKIMADIDVSSEDDTRSRERLFDIMMDRFEALNEYRDGICAILESFKYDPKQMVISAPYLCKSMSWMLEVSGVETAGIKGALKVAGLTGVYIKVLKVWIKDESPDLSKTMSALDKSLGHAENMANTLGL